MRLMTNDELLGVSGGVTANSAARVGKFLDAVGRATIVYDAATYIIEKMAAGIDWYQDTYSGGADGWTEPNGESLPT